MWQMVKLQDLWFLVFCGLSGPRLVTAVLLSVMLPEIFYCSSSGVLVFKIYVL